MEEDYEATAMTANPSTTSFRIDEGFAEDAATLDEHNNSEVAQLCQSWLMTRSHADRAAIAVELLRTLPTSYLSNIAKAMDPMLHMDPLSKLPAELIMHVLRYLDAPTLLTISLASKSWRDRALDTPLWLDLFIYEGWQIDQAALKSIEEKIHWGQLSSREHLSPRKGKARMISADESSLPRPKKRASPDIYATQQRQAAVELPNWGEQHTTPEIASPPQQDTDDQEMLDAPSAQTPSPARTNRPNSRDTDDGMDFGLGPSGSTIADIGVGQREPSSLFDTQLVTRDGQDKKLNWAYLYKQKHRLEENWLHGRYTTFQLPDPAHPEEAHTECVYCIQFSGRWLVSGSRDKTLRIWDMETRRLRGRPLTGHSQSVLCLQFDPAPEEDIIVSGSSDASIIIWKFSTGELIKEIRSAHDESVLNLRFDHRYLVTCSKDHKIKVWNRHDLSANSPDIPRIKANTADIEVAAYVIDIANTLPQQLDDRIEHGLKPLKAWSHLLTFRGHNAAVNAVQIRDDQIVSASGDRHIIIWSISKGQREKSLTTHMKGIACVQFDGRRVVSGSSDNTVRIYDPQSGAEVAVLQGHSNLVRAVQADFADVPGQEAEDFDEARKAEELLRQALANQESVEHDRHHARRVRNGQEGTSRPTFGAQLPPGGGGSKWRKIVSGSYDETIIVWRKNPRNGEWVVGQTLRHGRPRTTRRNHARNVPAAVPVVAAAGVPVLPVAGPAIAQPPVIPPRANVHINPTNIMSQAVNASLSTLGAGLSNIVGAARGLNGGHQLGGSNAAAGPSQSAHNATTTSWSAFAGGQMQVNSSFSIHPSITSFPPLGGRSTGGFQQSNTTFPTSMPPITHGACSSGSSTGAATTAAPPLAPAMVPAVAAQAPPPPPAPTANRRVFKLQFDARRVVCCSQDTRIVGWDFANNDPEIIECSPLFLG
ncbi:F-box/WD repeat-containing protein lin-23 [Cyphellophora attinorum]|uniref:Probable E3 ubiquitin ligase complex SCF subunit sconB n=1 Tax=Cyphellophora attinorum TaxID=1664694 RepID=A0A0N0NQD6_9EURO|nr:F-box/WD repeat-containing protein lin-23 [Phialophora attinorum]KPI43579.1 F-box/WD repeat-containing protein lin-23 [Phialophora attinorum]